MNEAILWRDTRRKGDLWTHRVHYKGDTCSWCPCLNSLTFLWWATAAIVHCKGDTCSWCPHHLSIFLSQFFFSLSLIEHEGHQPHFLGTDVHPTQSNVQPHLMLALHNMMLTRTPLGWIASFPNHCNSGGCHVGSHFLYIVFESIGHKVLGYPKLLWVIYPYFPWKIHSTSWIYLMKERHQQLQWSRMSCRCTSSMAQSLWEIDLPVKGTLRYLTSKAPIWKPNTSTSWSWSSTFFEKMIWLFV